MSELYSIILVEPITMAIVGTIGPFTSGPDAAHYATEDRDCQKDYHWTVVPTVKPVADDETEPTTCDNRAKGCPCAEGICEGWRK
jgi:hypothetical protein